MPNPSSRFLLSSRRRWRLPSPLPWPAWSSAWQLHPSSRSKVATWCWWLFRSSSGVAGGEFGRSLTNYRDLLVVAALGVRVVVADQVNNSPHGHGGTDAHHDPVHPLGDPFRVRPKLQVSDYGADNRAKSTRPPPAVGDAKGLLFRFIFFPLGGWVIARRRISHGVSFAHGAGSSRRGGAPSLINKFWTSSRTAREMRSCINCVTISAPGICVSFPRFLYSQGR